MKVNIGEIQINKKIDFGEIQVRKKINIGEFKIGIKQSKIKLEDLTITPSEEKQVFSGSYGNIEVNEIPEEYIVPKVKNNILILSRAEVKGGVLSI